MGCSIRRTCFNPVLGFLSVATFHPSGAVGMPDRFQSRAGFSVRRDPISTASTAAAGMFQSRAGFSVRRDQIDKIATVSGNPVSIPCWVFCPSRRHESDREPRGSFGVSIPCWVFCPSRRGRTWNTTGLIRRFNPVLGFLSVATRIGNCWASARHRVSIPCWVFCPSRRPAPSLSVLIMRFQSRAGFSVRRDSTTDRGRG